MAEVFDPAANKRPMSKIVKNISESTGIPLGWLFTWTAFLLGLPLTFAVWLTITLSDIRRDMHDIKSNIWTESAHEYWALELQRKNPSLNVPLNPAIFNKRLTKSEGE